MSYRVAFVGASGFGLRCLAEVALMPCCEVIGVITAPATFAISYRPTGVTNVLHADLSSWAHERKLPCEVLEGKMSDPRLIEQLKAWGPHLFLVVGWYHMLPQAMRDIAPAAGLHASLLPDYSGGAPLVWAMINGEHETGISFFRMDSGVDSGPIIGQAREPILSQDTIATLYGRIEERGIELLRAHLPRLADGSAVLTPQDESRRRVFPQRGPEDGRIEWSWPAGRIHDFVRAQTRPYPGAFTSLAGEPLTIWSSRPSQVVAPAADPPGTCRADAVPPVVRCGGGTALAIEEAEHSSTLMGARALAQWLAGKARRPGGRVTFAS